jgi:hypothetical protein
MGATDNAGMHNAGTDESVGGDTPGADTPGGDTVGERAAGWSYGAAMRGLVGACTLVGGLTWLLLNLQAPRPIADLLVGGVLAAGGLVLLMPHRIPLPRRWTAAGMTLAAVAGTAAGLASATEQVCCMFAYATGRGFPFRWLRRGAEAADPETARNLALAANWQVDVIAVAGNLLFWAFVGLLAVATLDAVRRSRRGRSEAHAAG